MLVGVAIQLLFVIGEGEQKREALTVLQPFRRQEWSESSEVSSAVLNDRQWHLALPCHVNTPSDPIPNPTSLRQAKNGRGIGWIYVQK